MSFHAAYRLLLGDYGERLSRIPPLSQEIRAFTGFQEHYQQHIEPHLWKFEQQRQETLSIMRQRLVRFAMTLPFLLIGGLVLFFVLGQIGIFLLCLGIFAGLYYCYLPAQHYQRTIKSIIFPAILRYFGEHYTFTERPSFRAEELRPSYLIPHFDEEKHEDEITGAYKGVAIHIIESELIDVRRNDKGKRRVTLFKGLFILFSVHKSFQGMTVIRRDSGRLGNIFSKPGHLERVRLEDPQFESTFEVYSNDQIEARYLLTTSFMERLLKLEQVFHGNSIEASFYDNKLLLKIATRKDWFRSSSVFSPATFHTDMETVLTEMQTLFQIIGILKLDQDIGM